MRPVGSAGLTFSSLRRTTRPVTLITLSSRRPSAVRNAAESGVNTTCVTP
jgi:hypothetical protein